MSHKILAVFETLEGRAVGGSRAIACAASDLLQGDTARLFGVLLGNAPSTAKQAFVDFPCNRIFMGASPPPDRFGFRTAVDAILDAIEQCGAEIILINQSISGRELAGAVAARIDAAICTDAQSLTLEDGLITVGAAKLGGSVIVRCARPDQGPIVVLVRSNLLTSADRSGSPEFIDVRTTANVEERAAEVEMRTLSAPAEVELALDAAEVIVSGGRGLGGPEPFTGMLRELADLLGGSVAATRAVVDAGWAPHAMQVGQTGKTVRPRLYIAVAISGAIQHRVGMQTAGTIIALNKDEKVPISEIADLFLIGDAFAVVPELTRLLREEKRDM